jgi:hypothetical protein
MSPHVPVTVTIAKGTLCYALDQFSIGPGARARVQALRDALDALEPTYDNLAETYDEYLLSCVFANAATRQSIVDYLKTHWFNPNPPDAYFPGVPVAEIHATGMIKALDLSLAGKGPVIPFDSWWKLDCPQVELIALVREEGGATVSKYVSQLICTPRPPAAADGEGPSVPIVGRTAQAYVTRLEDELVVTRPVRPRGGRRRGRGRG